MTTTVLGKTRFNISGAWSAATTYAIDDVVLYKNNWYRAKGAVTAGTLPTVTASWDNWYTTFNFLGTHQNGGGTLASGSSSGTTITVTSTTGLVAGQTVTVTSGTGAFASNTTVTVVNSSTQFTVSATPTTPLSGATVTYGWAYAVGDVVRYIWSSTESSGTGHWANARRLNQEEIFLCIAAHTSNNTTSTNPFATAYWLPISIANENQPSSIVSGAAKDLTGVYGSDWQKALWFANEGIIYDTYSSSSPYYGKGYKTVQDTRYNLWWIDGSGGVTGSGASNSGSSGSGNDRANAPGVTSMTFFFHDWYRSTDNGGAGVLTTPDGKPPRAIQIETGCDHTTVLFNNGEVHSWGYNGNYECGDRSTTNRNHPRRVGGTYGEVASGSASNVLRDVKIVRISQSFGGGDPISSQATHTLALDSTGAVWAWGYNGYGQCGDGTTTSVQVPTKIAQSYFNNETVVAIWASGANYGVSFAYTSANKLYAWGYNAYGQLGVNNLTNQSRPTLCTGIDLTGATYGQLAKLQIGNSASYSTCGILTTTGYTYFTGYNVNGNIGNGGITNVQTWTLSTTGPGSNGNCENMWILGGGQYANTFWRQKYLGDMYACGYNGGGNIGDGTTTSPRTTPNNCIKRVTGVTSNLQNVLKMATTATNGATASYLALCDDGRMYSNGKNDQGQLCNGQTTTFNNTLVAIGNGIEYENGLTTWVPISTPPNMTGKDEYGYLMIDGIIGWGYDAAGGFAWRNKYGRLMVNGGSNPTVLSVTSWGSGGSAGDYQCAYMTDLIQNG